MLEINIPGGEMFDSKNDIFISVDPITICLEHSLISISKWEMKYEKAFLVDDDKTKEELIDYVRCMTITKNVNPNCYLFLSDENLDQINAYIDQKMTATTITELPENRYGPKKKITSEVMYAMMVELGIPFECEEWHLNRLIMLIRVCKARSSPPKKMDKKDMLAQRRALNAQRMKKR